MIIHESAHTHIQSHKPEGAHALRIQITAGGCSGFSKHLSWCYSPQPDDVQVHASIVTDPISWEFIQNAQLSHVKDLQGSRFELQIPEAVGSCGCGVSFQI